MSVDVFNMVAKCDAECANTKRINILPHSILGTYFQNGFQNLKRLGFKTYFEIGFELKPKKAPEPSQ